MGMNKDRIVEILNEFFPGNWIEEKAWAGAFSYYGEQVLFPASIYVGFDSTVEHWYVDLGEGIAFASPSEGMAEVEDLAQRGILPGSEEELREVLVAFRFNLGQALEEMRRAYVKAVGHEHVYVEAALAGSRSEEEADSRSEEVDNGR